MGTKRFLIPCLGYEINTPNARDYDCEYEYAGEFGCEDCIVNGGKMDPRTGKKHRPRVYRQTVESRPGCKIQRIALHEMIQRPPFDPDYLQIRKVFPFRVAWTYKGYSFWHKDSYGRDVGERRCGEPIGKGTYKEAVKWLEAGGPDVHHCGPGTGCICYQGGTEPDPNCPTHGYPDENRCWYCGRYMKTKRWRAVK